MSQVWTRNNTWLPLRVRHRWIYPQHIVDIFSRKITAYEISEEESVSQAALLMHRTSLPYVLKIGVMADTDDDDRAQHPERWSKETRNWTPIPEVYLNPEKKAA